MRFAASPGFQNAMAAVSGLGVDYNDLTSAGQKGRSMQQQTALQSEGKLKSTEQDARGMVGAAEHMADATRAQGAAAGQASMVSGIASGISGLAGGLGGMGGGGGGGGFTSPLTGIGYSTPIPYAVSNTPSYNSAIGSAFLR